MRGSAGRGPSSHLALRGGLASGGPAGVGQAVLGVAVWRGAAGRQRADGGALRRLLLQELLRLPVVQRDAAGLQGHGVGAHAGVEPAAPGRPQLLQVVPVQLLAGQQTHALHDADLLTAVAPLHAPLHGAHSQ